MVTLREIDRFIMFARARPSSASDYCRKNSERVIESVRNFFDLYRLLRGVSSKVISQLIFSGGTDFIVRDIKSAAQLTDICELGMHIGYPLILGRPAWVMAFLRTPDELRTFCQRADDSLGVALIREQPDNVMARFETADEFTRFCNNLHYRIGCSLIERRAEKVMALYKTKEAYLGLVSANDEAALSLLKMYPLKIITLFGSAKVAMREIHSSTTHWSSFGECCSIDELKAFGRINFDIAYSIIMKAPDVFFVMFGSYDRREIKSRLYDAFPSAPRSGLVKLTTALTNADTSLAEASGVLALRKVKAAAIRSPSKSSLPASVRLGM